MSAAALPQSILVIGGGVAAYTFVDQLRLRGYRGELGLVTSLGLPTDLPPVSKEYLRGVMGADELAFQDKAYYEERDIVVAEGPATELRVPADPDDAAQLCEVRVHRDNCSSEISLRAELVVLATGARAIHAAAGAKPAVIRQRITTLRSARDADVVRSYLSTGARVVILGGGLIGAEAASAAVEAGAQVTLVNRSAPAAASAFGEVAAREFERQHEDHGVRLVTSVSVGESVDGDEVTVTLESKMGLK